MRVLKSGEVRFKASAFKESDRLAQAPSPMPVFIRHSQVQVYMGSGWQAGSVVSSTPLRCMIWLSKAQRMICCTDKRNIRNPTK